MLAKVFSAALVGLEAVPIEVEVDISSQGLPSFTIVGLPDKAVEEAKERVRSALRNTGTDFPARRITVNLAPADLPKEGPSYDLPIAIGILLASGQMQADLTDSLFSGELSLDGQIRPVPGILPYAFLAKEQKLKRFFVPYDNAVEASCVEKIQVFGCRSLKEILHHFLGDSLLPPLPLQPLDSYYQETDFEFDLKDIKGQHQAKRALEIAAAGNHNILLKGPPGSGKTLLARTFPSILPRLETDEALEIMRILSISDILNNKTYLKRPFRAPHHSTSLVGLIGGSSNPRPGEITLAHRGVLFLDEFPEFPRNVLETLRQPLEDGFVTISRATNKVTFPAKCLLIAAQNPCPCGFFGDPHHTCSCNPTQIARYQKKVSGPLLERIDIHVEVPAIKTEKLVSGQNIDSESSSVVRQRVQKARDQQKKRFLKTPFRANAEITNKAINRFCPLSEECLTLLRSAVSSLHLSGRTYHRIIKLARTIADLAEAENITPSHLAEALQYRPKHISLS